MSWVLWWAGYGWSPGTWDSSSALLLGKLASREGPRTTFELSLFSIWTNLSLIYLWLGTPLFLFFSPVHKKNCLLFSLMQHNICTPKSCACAPKKRKKKGTKTKAVPCLFIPAQSSSNPAKSICFCLEELLFLKKKNKTKRKEKNDCYINEPARHKFEWDLLQIQSCL